MLVFENEPGGKYMEEGPRMRQALSAFFSGEAEASATAPLFPGVLGLKEQEHTQLFHAIPSSFLCSPVPVS